MEDYVTVHFPGKSGYFRVPVNDVTEEAVKWLSINDDGYHHLEIKADEETLIPYAEPVWLGGAQKDGREREPA
jgi:hypothetical protein